MAEILGAVASGLAVAEVGLKVGGTVWKLKRLWQQVHEVPETIQDLMRQIEIMEPVLVNHEANLQVRDAGLLEQLPTPHGPPATLSAEYCREALNDLRNLVEDLDRAIKTETRSRRTFARVGVVLKKDTIRGFQDRLERAIKLLQWTQVNFLAANATIMRAMVTDVWTAVTSIQSQQQLFMQQLGNDYSHSTGNPPFPVVTSHVEPSREHIIDKRKSIQHQRNSIHIPWSGPSVFGALEVRKSETDNNGETTYAVRLQLPKWFSRKVWDINISRACSGWQGSLSTWNIVRRNSPGMICAMRGDLDGLIDLFDRGLASPRDCTTKGFTLFLVAGFCFHTPIAKYFMSMNMDRPFTTAGVKELSATCLLLPRLPIDIIRHLVSRGLIDDLATEAECELLNNTLEYSHARRLIPFSLAWTMNCPEKFDLVFRRCFPFWRNLPPIRKQKLLEPLSFELGYGNVFQFWTPNVFRLLFCPDGPVRKSDVQAWTDGGASLLRQALSCYLTSSSRGLDRGWRTLLEEVVEATDDLHGRTFGGYYSGARSALEWALLGVLSGLLCVPMVNAKVPIRYRVLKKFTVKLQAIMSVLASCGYDLLEFGRQEAAIWVRPEEKTNSRVVGDALCMKIGGEHDGFPYVRAVHYGSEPKDWYFELDLYYEDYAGDFWNLLENPRVLMVPGAWIADE